jgi:hypothetical protein
MIWRISVHTGMYRYVPDFAKPKSVHTALYYRRVHGGTYQYVPVYTAINLNQVYRIPDGIDESSSESSWHCQSLSGQSRRESVACHDDHDPRRPGPGDRDRGVTDSAAARALTSDREGACRSATQPDWPRVPRSRCAATPSVTGPGPPGPPNRRPGPPAGANVPVPA